MKPKIMDMSVDWERVKTEQLAPLLSEGGDENSGMNPVMTVGDNDRLESLLKTLVQQAARN